jgi:YidC/Oxa1 family membrane protein insertase
MDKKGIAGIAVCVLLLLAWFPLASRLGWLKVPPPAPEQEESQALASAPADPSPAPPPVSPQAAPLAQASDAADLELTTAPERLRMAATQAMELVFSPRQGGVANVQLHDYQEEDRQTEVTLGTADWPFLTVLAGADDRLVSPKILEQTAERLVLQRRSLKTGLLVHETWSTRADNLYGVDYAVSFQNAGEQALELSELSISCGQLTRKVVAAGNKMSKVGASDLSADVAGVEKTRTYTSSKVEKLEDDDRQEMSSQGVKWLAVHTKYFAFGLISQGQPFSGCRLQSETDDAGRPSLRGVVYLPAQKLAPGASAQFQYAAYAGPKAYDQLRGLKVGMERIMGLDLFFFFHPSWMGGLTSGMLRTLVWLNAKIDHRWGYGFAIILITFLIKMVFWPLTHRSTVSMRKMQKVQPLLKELREKYKDQPQKIQQKTMELYKEHRVNPMGGCLPIVLQIPVFFALFNTLRGAIELRHASFMWVVDLAQPDTLPWMLFGLPIRPLAILMGVTMLLQQQLMPSSADPNQKRMMSFMSLFFIVMFYSMPAGLTLYWTVNQVLTIIQNLVSQRMETAAAGKVSPVNGSAK